MSSASHLATRLATYHTPTTPMIGHPTELANASSPLLARFWYGAPIADFLGTPHETVLGQLAANCEFALLPTQRDAWLAQVTLLHAELTDLGGWIFFEFNIPRMGRRIDVVLTIGPVVFAIEFKVGEKVFDPTGIDQAWDYALDLKNFHEASHAAAIVPILVATAVTAPPALRLAADPDQVYRPLLATPANFRAALKLALTGIAGPALDSHHWSRAPYHPTPTIVDAARALYAQHSVEAIARFGGGQEINLGEAGIEAWLQAIHQHFPAWHIFISSRLTDSEYAAGGALEAMRQRPRTHFDDRLHLAVSMRSFRAEHVSAFVKALLDCETQQAREMCARLAGRYPIRLTRDLGAARNWIRAQARGSERYGLVASSKAMRLKPHAIDIRVSVDPVHYFLNQRDDTRSSYYLEDAATEFQVQGLELDWVCVTWDGDFRFNGSGWSYHDFRGKSWCNIANSDNRVYLRNAYRVLLTRARQGMVIFVPPGESSDPTRSPAFYNATFAYLSGLGIPELT